MCPSGKLLASVNSTHANRVVAMLMRGLDEWELLDQRERRLDPASEIAPQHRWEQSFPTGGLVLNVVSRDLPAGGAPDAICAEKWNQDYAWFSKDEARGWLGDDPQPGDVHVLPKRLTDRLVRFHLVDNVKGETPAFTAQGVDKCTVATEVVGRTGDAVELRITGATTAVAADGWWQSDNGVVARLYGRAEFRLDKAAFSEFELVALGRRWGYTRFNGRDDDPPSGPIGYVLRLPRAKSPRVAPTAVAQYQADWIVRPE